MDPPNEDDPSDHDLLVRLDERVRYIWSWTKAHDAEHAKVLERINSNRVLVFTAVLAAAASLIGVGLDLLVRR